MKKLLATSYGDVVYTQTIDGKIDVKDGCSENISNEYEYYARLLMAVDSVAGSDFEISVDEDDMAIFTTIHLSDMTNAELVKKVLLDELSYYIEQVAIKGNNINIIDIMYEFF